MKRYKHNLKRSAALTGRRFSPSHFGFISERPPLVDLRSMLPGAFDQGEEGSCGPNSASALMCFFNPGVAAFSRQQIYYCVRQLEGSVSEDAGVETKDLFAILHDIGAAPETLWPYEPANFSAPPSQEVIEAASKYKIQSFEQLVSEEDFLGCLAEGFPFILGFECFTSIESHGVEKSGVLPRPMKHEKDLGGHDVLVVGYDTNFLQSKDFGNSGLNPSQVSNTALLIRNSWSAEWGLNGHFWMPIDFASNARTGGDAWTARV